MEKKNKRAISYKDSGVDVHAGYKAVDLIKQHAKSTFDANVIGGLGGFGGFYSLENMGLSNPVLVAGTDGVGTKLRYAFVSGRHDTIGIDCVAMCANDVVCQGAKPLFFLDYLAVGKLVPETAAEIVSGVSAGCRQSGCALIGGETAEMPGFYPEGEYDIAGFCVGIADRKRIIDGSTISSGDALIGLASSGLHSNGFSLVRRLLGEDREVLQSQTVNGESLLEHILTPTRIYVHTILTLMERFVIKGIAHITGGGLIENLPRMLPSGIGAKVDTRAWPRPAIFEMLAERSGLQHDQLHNTFNMGIGMVLCVDKQKTEAVIQAAEALGERAYCIGETIAGEGLSFEPDCK